MDTRQPPREQTTRTEGEVKHRNQHQHHSASKLESERREPFGADSAGASGVRDTGLSRAARGAGRGRGGTWVGTARGRGVWAAAGAR